VHRWSIARTIERRGSASAELDAFAEINAIDWSAQFLEHAS
jgi:hypothetical protein